MSKTVSYSIFLKDHMSSSLISIGNTGQSTFSKIDHAQGKTQNEIRKTKSEAEGLNSVLGKVGKTIAGLFVFDKMVSFGKGVVDTTALFQKYDAVLGNVYNSSDKAAEKLKMLNDFAVKTPFTLDGLMEGFANLTKQGFELGDEEMTKLGDLASFSAKEFDQLSNAIINAETGMFSTLKAFGITTKQNSDNTLTFTFLENETTIENSTEAIRKYMLSLGETEGVTGSMEAISKTLGGRISNLQDNFTGLQLAIGTSSNNIFTFLIDGASIAIDFFTSLFDEGNKLTSTILTLGGATAAGVLAFKGFVIISTITKLMKSGAAATWLMTTAQSALNFVMAMNPIGLVIAGLAALTAGITIAWNKFEGFRKFMFSLWETIKQVFSNIGNFFKGIFEPVIEALATFQDDSLSIFEKTKKIGGNMLQLGYNLSPVGMAKNLYDFTKDGGLTDGVADAWEEGQKKGAESWAKSQEKKGKTNSPFAPHIIDENDDAGSSSVLAEATGRTAIGGGRGGGGASRNMTIHIESLVKDLTISTTNLQESASAIESKINEVLVKAIRDFEIAY